MTDSSPRVTYVDWDYENKVAIRYERTGFCNGCGGCCIKELNYDLYDGHPFTHGGTKTDGRKRWSEIETEKRSEFIRFWHEDNPWHKPCKALGENNSCGLEDDKPWICAVFPTSPADMVPFPECSYVFTEIERWTIEE